MKNPFRGVLVAASAGLLAAGLAIAPAGAAVTFDSSTGEGFVGKGDVQTAFGWSNSQMQANFNGVSFQYTEKGKYKVTCEVIRDNKKEPYTDWHTNTVNTKIDEEVAFDPRKRNQMTGFILTGYGSTSTQGAPVVGDVCTAHGVTGELSAVEPQSDSSATLEAMFGSTSVVLQ
jgi:hypothetical protein